MILGAKVELEVDDLTPDDRAAIREAWEGGDIPEIPFGLRFQVETPHGIRMKMVKGVVRPDQLIRLHEA